MQGTLVINKHKGSVIRVELIKDEGTCVRVRALETASAWKKDQTFITAMPIQWDV